MAPKRSAFTIIELAVVTGTAAIAGAMCLATFGPALQPAGEKQPEKQPTKEKDGTTNALLEARAKARQKKDEVHIRGIVQSMQIWANNNQGKFPLPSEIDAADTTVKGPAASKDTTANILSILIYTGGISTEICYSPAEASKKIEIDEDYMFDAPKTAAKPADALWDPAFNADFTGDKKGNDSYAHVQPSKERWKDTMNALDPVWSNRAPSIEKIEPDANGVRSVKLVGRDSITFLIHGAPDKWEGLIGYNDGHVGYETSLLPDYGTADKKWPTFVDKESKKQIDCLYFDEPDSDNILMGIFTKSGAAKKDWQQIWD